MCMLNLGATKEEMFNTVFYNMTHDEINIFNIVVQRGSETEAGRLDIWTFPAGNQESITKNDIVRKSQISFKWHDMSLSSFSFFRSFSIDQRPVWNLIASLLIGFLHLISFVIKLGSVYRRKMQNNSTEWFFRCESKSIQEVTLIH